jgi:hypothetical protein
MDFRRIASIIAIVLASVAATGCGGSDQSDADKAKSQACDASADIKSQIATLKNLPLSTSSVDTAKTSLQKIDEDPKTISDAAPKLSDDLRSQLETANATFKTQVQQATDAVTSADSVSAAATAIVDASGTLQASYEKAFANVGC